MIRKKRNHSLDECVYFCLRDGNWWTFWQIQKTIQEKEGTLYGEPTISAGIRNLRKTDRREKFNLKPYGEVVELKRIPNRKGYMYRLIK